MLTEHVVYSIRCDKCDTQFVKNEKIFYNDKATLLREAESNEWINSSNMHFCPHCYNTCKDTITSLIKEANFWIDVIVLKGLHTYEEACRLVPDGYRLPTVDDFKKLSQDSQYVFDQSNKSGVFFFNENFSLKLPAAGMKMKNLSSINKNIYGYYWSGSKYDNSDYYILSFCKEMVCYNDSPLHGCRISAVYIKK